MELLAILNIEAFCPKLDQKDLHCNAVVMSCNLVISENMLYFVTPIGKRIGKWLKSRNLSCIT